MWECLHNTSTVHLSDGDMSKCHTFHDLFSSASSTRLYPANRRLKTHRFTQTNKNKNTMCDALAADFHLRLSFLATIALLPHTLQECSRSAANGLRRPGHTLSAQLSKQWAQTGKTSFLPAMQSHGVKLLRSHHGGVRIRSARETWSEGGGFAVLSFRGL